MSVAVASTCTACGLCLATCPERALVAAPRRPRVVDERCTDCWLCLEVCPVDAITASAAALPGLPNVATPMRRESGRARGLMVAGEPGHGELRR